MEFHGYSNKKYFVHISPPITKCIFKNSCNKSNENYNNIISNEEEGTYTKFYFSSKPKKTKKDKIFQFILRYSNSQNKSPLHFDIDNLVETKIINDNLKEKNDMCIICQECFEKEQTILILQCEHFFHRDCLLMWFKYQNKCPLCKTIVH